MVEWSGHGAVRERIVSVGDNIDELETTMLVPQPTEDSKYTCRIRFEGVDCHHRTSGVCTWSHSFAVKKSSIEGELVQNSNDNFLSVYNIYRMDR